MSNRMFSSTISMNLDLINRYKRTRELLISGKQFMKEDFDQMDSIDQTASILSGEHEQIRSAEKYIEYLDSHIAELESINRELKELNSKFF